MTKIGIKAGSITAVGSIVAAFAIAVLLLWATGFRPCDVARAPFDDDLRLPIFDRTDRTTGRSDLMCAVGIAFAARLGLWEYRRGGPVLYGCPRLGRDIPILSDLAGLSDAARHGDRWPCGRCFLDFGPALLRAYGGVSEILTTLMLNYVAVPLMNYFLYGPWKSPNSFNFPVTNRFTDNAFLPILPGFPVHFGFVIALGIAAIMDFTLWHTTFGFRVRAAGNNRTAAAYAGYRICAIDVTVLCLSGALAGLAGMLQLTGVTHQLLPNISPGYGYLAIIVASLALTSIRGCVLVSILLAIILVGSQGMETTGVPSGIASFLSAFCCCLR